MDRTAADIMETDVLSVSSESSLVDIQRLFVDEEIHGAPVVGSDGMVQGVISSADLMRAVADEHESVQAQPYYLRETIEFYSPDWLTRSEDFRALLGQLRAVDVMTAKPITVSPDTPVSEIAHVIARNQIHRVLVVDDGRLVGIISTFDLVRLLEQKGQVPTCR